MKYKTLGKTNLKISNIGFGSWAIGGNKHGNSYGKTDDRESIDCLNKAYELGCNFFDTADIYGHGHSESLIGKFLKEQQRDKIVVATKGGMDFYSSSIRSNFSIDYLKEAINKSLSRLDTDYIDLYQLHNPSKDILKNQELFDQLEDIKKSGKVRSFGVSVCEESEILIASNIEIIDSIQFTYNIFEQDYNESSFKKLKKKNIGMIAREPLSNGLLTGKYKTSHYFPPDDIRHSWPISYISLYLNFSKSLQGLLNEETDTLVKLAIKYILANKNIDTVIPGCKTLKQTNENMSIFNSESLSEKEIYKVYELYKKRFNA